MFNSQKGLTLTELLVVTGIILIMSAVVLPTWNRGRERLKVIRAAYQLNQDIRRAQELTLANAECKQCACSDGDGARSYGLYFDMSQKDSYILFQDCNGNKVYNPGEEKEEITLESKVELEQLEQLPQGATPTTLNIVFLPPDPTVIVRDNYGTYPQEDVRKGIIKLKADNFTREVATNKIGLVEVIKE